MPKAKRKRNFQKYEVIGRLLADRRRKLGMTQAQVGKLLRRPQSFVSNVEAGQHRVDVVELLTFAEALSFDPARFVRQLRGSLR